MRPMKDLTEFAICNDIAARMAMFALAKSCTDEEINMLFNVIEEDLVGAEGAYEEERITPLVNVYRQGVLSLRKRGGG